VSKLLSFARSLFSLYVREALGTARKKKNLLWEAGPIDLMAFADDGALKNHLGPSMSIIGQLIPPQHIIYIQGKNVRDAVILHPAGCFHTLYPFDRPLINASLLK
jgi:hypothetical protein